MAESPASFWRQKWQENETKNRRRLPGLRVSAWHGDAFPFPGGPNLSGFVKPSRGAGGDPSISGRPSSASLLHFAATQVTTGYIMPGNQPLRSARGEGTWACGAAFSATPIFEEGRTIRAQKNSKNSRFAGECAGTGTSAVIIGPPSVIAFGQKKKSGFFFPCGTTS